MKIQVVLIVFLSMVWLVRCEHLILGDANKKTLIHHTVAQYHAIPFTKRVKEVFFSSPDQRVINSILVYDNLHSLASATVTAGGVGYTYVNIRMKSERGKGLDYDIGIYS
ncbi:hypothetical protein ABMA27_001550 [Loxostege sticticalis]|uniref:Salivary secreted peptide n=1 Tax=Loxostege sticticalis TaxID=481309 RepID=A0ABR3HYX7_LOXSC